MNFAFEVDLWTDAGETGWGAQSMGTLAEGVFEQELIGTSSTRRELTALVRAIRHGNLAPLLTGKVVRVNMDSAAGVANLMKGGGPKVELCRLVKE